MSDEETTEYTDKPYLSWSGSELWEGCKREFWHKYIDKTVLPIPDNKVHMLYGETVGRLFQYFYRDKVWRAKNLGEAIGSMVNPIMKSVVLGEQYKGGVFDFTEKDLKDGTRSLKEIRQEVLNTIPIALQTIKNHKLIGKDVEAELKLNSEVEGAILAGRADFVMTRPSPFSDLVIVDGKGSRHRDLYTNQEQVFWYAMLYREKFQVLPDKVGYLYWRFKDSDAMDWIQVTEDKADRAKKRGLRIVDEIEKAKTELAAGEDSKNVFPATFGDSCRLCSFKSICPEYAYYSSKEVKQAAKDSLIGVDGGSFSL